MTHSRPRTRAGVLLAIVISAIAASFAIPCLALEIGRGSVPIERELGQDTRLDPSDELVVEGTVTGADGATVLVRVDDGRSIDWATRFNHEAGLSAGPFRFRFRLGELKTQSGRAIEAGSIRRIVIASIAGNGNVAISRATLSKSEPPNPPQALALPTGPTPIHYQPRLPLSFSEKGALTVEGVIDGGPTANILLRIDDAQSSNYASRINIERTLPKGPFSLKVAPVGLKTPSGRVLDHRNVVRIIFTGLDAGARVTVKRFTFGPAPRLPDGAEGYVFATPAAPAMPELIRISPGDPRLLGTVVGVARVAPDPIVATGLKGIDVVRLPWSNGPARVSLFTEDPGEWEYLPHPLRRSITVNGTPALRVQLTPEQWIRSRYLRLEDVEHTAADDAWTAYGRYRGNVVSVVVDPGAANEIVIALDGDSPEAKHLSAVIIEPPQSTAGLDFVQAARAEWYRSNHPVAKLPDQGALRSTKVVLDSNKAPIPVSAVSAPGADAWLSISISSKRAIVSPNVVLHAPRFGNAALDGRVWVGERRLERFGNLLALGDNRLISRLDRSHVEPGSPRTYEIWLKVPKGSPEGIYTGALEVTGGGESHRVPLNVDVIAVDLPQAPKPAGFYSFHPPHYAFFPATSSRGQKQAACDYETLSYVGAVAGTSPPVPPLGPQHLGRFIEEMTAAYKGGVAPGWLLYGGPPESDLDDHAKAIGAATALMVTSGLGQAVWSAADEPSNPDMNNEPKVRAWVSALRRNAPLARIAAQLNSTRDQKLIGLFDVAVVNEGFGLDKALIDRLASEGRSIWIYNVDNIRAAAGIWLWNTRALRYVQWHARSPSADPYDPLDGREADFQVLYPSFEVCPPQPDIHRNLLRMGEGVLDQRWLAWLDEQSGTEAERLRAEIKRRIGDRWREASKLNSQTLNDIRKLIIDLARKTASTRHPGDKI